MIKQIVFTEKEWNEFRLQVGRELHKSVSKYYDVTAKYDGKNINNDGKEEHWWMGIACHVIDLAANNEEKR